MTWPRWTDELKDHYLGDEASAFLVVGDIHAERWLVDGERLDAANVLVRYLARSRSVVGVLRNGVGPGLRFATYADEKKFDELVDAAILLNGKALALSPREPREAMGRIWQALTTTGCDQAYMVVDVDQMVPARRRRVDPIPGAPGLFEWPSHPTLRKSNNLVVFLASSADAVRPELVEACWVIDLAKSGEPTAAQLAAMQHLTDDVLEDDAPSEVPADGSTPSTAPTVSPASDAPAAPAASDDLGPPPEPPGSELPPVPTVPAAPTAPAGPLTWEDVVPHLENNLVACLLAHPEDHRPAKLPVMDAVAKTLDTLGSRGWGSMVFSLDEEGKASVEGAGADEFIALWRGDIALDAAAGMLLKALKGGFSQASPPDLDETALRALSKRITKKLV